MSCASTSYSGGRVDNTTFTNWSGRFSGPVGSMFEPDTLQDLVNVVQQATNAGKPLHVVGSGWAFENIAYSSGFMVRLSRLNHHLTNVTGTALNAKWAASQAAGNDALFHIEAGASIADVNDALGLAGLALPTMGGANGQALAGAISTGTHGGDIGLPPLAGIVMAMHLVTTGGREIWIERASEPITDDLALARALSCKDTEILRNDDVFNALLVGFGRFGVIYSYVLRVVKPFNLAEWTVKIPGMTLTMLLAEGIATGNLFAPLLANLPAPPAALGAQGTAFPRGLEIVFDTNNLGECWVKRRWPSMNTTTIGLADSQNPLCVAGAAGVLAAAHTVLLPFTGIPIYGQVIAAELTALSASLVTNPGMTPGEMLASVLNLCWSTGLGGVIPQISGVEFGLQYQDSVGQGKLGRSDLIISGFRDQSLQGCYRADSIEPVFDAHQAGYLNFLQSVVSTAPSMKQAGYISLRWSASTKATMSMHNFASGNAVAIEVTSLRGLPDNAKWMSSVEAFAIANGGRPHWGQINTSNAAAVTQQFGSAHMAWRTTLGLLVGQAPTFSNAFTVQRGLEPLLGAIVALSGKTASSIIAASIPTISLPQIPIAIGNPPPIRRS